MKVCPTCRAPYGDEVAFCPRDGGTLRVSGGLEPGTIIKKKYEIISEIARGGMGVVYRVRHLFWNEERAIKFLLDVGRGGDAAGAGLLGRGTSHATTPTPKHRARGRCRIHGEDPRYFVRHDGAEAAFWELEGLYRGGVWPELVPTLHTNCKAAELRSDLVRIALAWQRYFGVAPHVATAISELDAALLVGMTEEEYCADGALRTAVTKGKDFTYRDVRYQVTANWPSGKKGSPVTLVSLKRKFEWDKLIWLLYNREYVLQEAWEFTVDEYKSRFSQSTRLSPDHMRLGRCLFKTTPQ